RSRDACHRRLFATVIPNRLADSRVTIGPPGALMMRLPVRALIPFSAIHCRKVRTWSSFKFAGTFFMAVRDLSRARAGSKGEVTQKRAKFGLSLMCATIAPGLGLRTCCQRRLTPTEWQRAIYRRRALAASVARRRSATIIPGLGGKGENLAL